MDMDMLEGTEESWHFHSFAKFVFERVYRVVNSNEKSEKYLSLLFVLARVCARCTLVCVCTNIDAQVVRVCVRVRECVCM